MPYVRAWYALWHFFNFMLYVCVAVHILVLVVCLQCALVLLPPAVDAMEYGHS